MYVGFMYLTLQLSTLRCDDTESRLFRGHWGVGALEMGNGGGVRERRHHINAEVEQMSNLSRSCLLFHPQHAWLKPLMPMPTNAGVCVIYVCVL